MRVVRSLWLPVSALLTVALAGCGSSYTERVYVRPAPASYYYTPSNSYYTAYPAYYAYDRDCPRKPYC